jgi:hypothetical protein
MAQRPVYLPTSAPPFFKVELVEFTWFPGYSKEQKQRSIRSLHENAAFEAGVDSPLEISSKSTSPLGYKLSAFNLPAYSNDKRYQAPPCSLEMVFQTSKVFGEDVHCIDLVGEEVRQVRKTVRERESKGLEHFRFEEVDWPIDPKGAFYNFIYLRSLNELGDEKSDILRYDGFTDIEFNPKKSINCQAEAVSIFVGISRAGLDLKNICTDKETFLETVYPTKANVSRTDSSEPYQEEMSF